LIGVIPWVGLVYSGYLWVGKLMGEPAPTDFLPYFRINFLPHFTIAVGAGLPISLIATDNCSKPAPTPPIISIRDSFGAGFYDLSVVVNDVGERAPTKSTAIGLLLFDHQNICVYPHLRLSAFICGFKKTKW
jgi:hypothetical protein